MLRWLGLTQEGASPVRWLQLHLIGAIWNPSLQAEPMQGVPNALAQPNWRHGVRSQKNLGRLLMSSRPTSLLTDRKHDPTPEYQFFFGIDVFAPLIGIVILRRFFSRFLGVSKVTRTFL